MQGHNPSEKVVTDLTRRHIHMKTEKRICYVREAKAESDSLKENKDLTVEISFRSSKIDSLLGAKTICALCSSPIEIL